MGKAVTTSTMASTKSRFVGSGWADQRRRGACRLMADGSGIRETALAQLRRVMRRHRFFFFDFHGRSGVCLLLSASRKQRIGQAADLRRQIIAQDAAFTPQSATCSKCNGTAEHAAVLFFDLRESVRRNENGLDLIEKLVTGRARDGPAARQFLIRGQDLLDENRDRTG